MVKLFSTCVRRLHLFLFSFEYYFMFSRNCSGASFCTLHWCTTKVKPGWHQPFLPHVIVKCQLHLHQIFIICYFFSRPLFNYFTRNWSYRYTHTHTHTIGFIHKSEVRTSSICQNIQITFGKILGVNG